MNKNVVSSLIVPLRDRSPHIGLYLYDRRGQANFVSYQALYQHICRAMCEFRAIGIRPGSRVILPFSTSIESITAFFALIGMKALPFSVKLPISGGSHDEYCELLQGLIRRFGCVAIVTTKAMPIRLEGVVQVQVSTASLDHRADVEGIEWANPAPEDIAFVQFSSGTTGQQKGVPIRHGQLIRQLELILSQDDRSSSDVGASWLPLYHDMGLVGSLLSTMLAGHSLHLDSPAGFLMDPLAWLASLSTHRVSITALPNFSMSYLLKRLGEADADELSGCRFDALRRIYVGSDVIDASVVSRLTQLLQPLGLSDKAITPCYGMAEAVLMVSCKPANDTVHLSSIEGRRDVVSVGTVLPEFEVRILVEGNRQGGSGEEGEILIRGGTLAYGYFEDERAMIDADGFYHSGDIGYLQDGHLFISGRIGERIKINGENHFLPYLENTIQSHPGLRPGGVAMIQSGKKLIVLAEPKAVSTVAELGTLRSELSTLLMAKTGIKVPREQIFLVRRGQLKRTSSGKLQRSLICQTFERQGFKAILNESGADNRCS
ncbi:AMP-binding protein [Xenorhabdus sp. TH1]|uniref:AMP-binding protein n=1 Tax=Xenorhabdus sp. TH1 TaxID=3130166 RepID=UPI0030D60EC7